MGRLSFDSSGKLIAVDSKIVNYHKQKEKRKSHHESSYFSEEELKKSDSLKFLQDEERTEDKSSREYWSLYEGDSFLEPLKFSNEKTQEDIVKEIVELIRKKEKVIFLHGVCGTGKSAIALNIARALGGKSAIIVPIKSLQKQYEEEYMGKKYLIRESRKMKMAMLTGRDNHDSIIFPGVSCADPFLPDTIRLSDKNYEKIKKYYFENPFISNDILPSIRRLRRISIAPSNPYWSPITPADRELNQLKDAKKIRYAGMYGRDFIFHYRKAGCSYYDQYLAYIEADVIIFNSAKYLAEVSMGRKPATEVDIIDEADEFLDSFSNNIEINLTRLGNSLKTLNLEDETAEKITEKIIRFIEAEEANKKAIGVNPDFVYHINETKIKAILESLMSSAELESEIVIDEMNYANQALEAAHTFEDSFEDAYATFRKEEDNLFVNLVTTDLSKKFKELVNGNKSLVLMSGTLHTETVLRNIFGIEKFVRVDAEKLNQGSIDILKTGKEFDCRYSNFKDKKYSRGQYLIALEKSIEKAEKPCLIHVNAFNDLPDSDEKIDLGIENLITKEALLSLQFNDRKGATINDFKKGKMDKLFTTKCSRGIDFPGKTCNSVIFTKYPNPNVKDTFWKILQKTHPAYYWDFYKDKARREFLQRIYRAVRSKEDHVYVLSPDSRVLEAVRELQINGNIAS